MHVTVLESSGLLRVLFLLAMRVLLEVVVGLLAKESLDELVLDLLLPHASQLGDVRQSGCLELVLPSRLLSVLGSVSSLITKLLLMETLRVRSVLDLPNLARQVASEVVVGPIFTLVK